MSVWDHISHLNAVRWSRMGISGRMFPHLKQIKLSCTPLTVATAALTDLMCPLCLQLSLSPSRATYEELQQTLTWTHMKASMDKSPELLCCPKTFSRFSWQSALSSIGKVSVRWGLRGSGKGERLGKVKVLLEVFYLSLIPQDGGRVVRLCCPSGTEGMRMCICVCEKRGFRMRSPYYLPLVRRSHLGHVCLGTCVFIRAWQINVQWHSFNGCETLYIF